MIQSVSSGNTGIVPPWLQDPWPMPVGPDVPRIFCDHNYYSDPNDRDSCKDCHGVREPN